MGSSASFLYLATAQINAVRVGRRADQMSIVPVIQVSRVVRAVLDLQTVFVHEEARGLVQSAVDHLEHAREWQRRSAMDQACTVLYCVPVQFDGLS